MFNGNICIRTTLYMYKNKAFTHNNHITKSNKLIKIISEVYFTQFLLSPNTKPLKNDTNYHEMFLNC